MKPNCITAMGAGATAGIGRLGTTGMFLAQTLLYCLTPPVKGERVLRQIWFIGWKSMLVIALDGNLHGDGAWPCRDFRPCGEWVPRPFLGQWSRCRLIRELGPVLTALMVTGRAGSAIAAEIGIMRTS